MPSRQVAELKITDTRPDEPLHFVASDFPEHPSNLSVDSLTQNHADAYLADEQKLFDAGAFAIQHHAAEEPRRERRVPGFVEGDIVFFVDLVTRMRQALREIAVVREDEQAFGLRVEAADVEQAGELRRQQIEDRVAGVWIGSSGNVSSRLMQNEVEPQLRPNDLATDFDVIFVGRFGAEISDHAAIDGHTSSRDQFITMPTRTNTRGGKETIEAHTLGGSLVTGSR